MAGCGKRITWRFAICANCEKTYGNSALGWPNWLRFLWQDEQKNRRRDKKIRKFEETESDLGFEAGEEFGDE
jgi:hypothetical protein